MASRWVRIVPAFRHEVTRGLKDAASRSSPSALRPFGESGGSRNPMSFVARELRNMERDMNRLQSMFFNDHNRSSIFRPFASFFDNNSLLGSGGGGGRQGCDRMTDGRVSAGDMSDYIVEGKDGKQKLQLEFDAQGFKPEDIQISTRSGNRLEIHAKYQDESEGHRVYQEYTKVLTLPEGVDAKQVECNFHDNSLTIEAPYTPPKVEQSKQQQIGSSNGGPRKIDVKHLHDDESSSTSRRRSGSGAEDAHDDVEGGSQPMVSGSHDTKKHQDRWANSSTASTTSTSGSAGQTAQTSAQQQADNATVARAAAVGGRR